MKQMYSKKLVMDYINGNDIEEYSIDELENDPNFMIQVMEVTKDKNIYNLCSTNVKKDHQFIIFLINNFKNDLNFISKAADFYLDQEIDDTLAMEIYILLSKIENFDDNLKFMEYRLKAETFYIIKVAEISSLKEEKDDYLLGKGNLAFLLIQEEYQSSSIIVNFFAEKFINDIFYENGKEELEKIIHSKVKKFSYIEEQGINTFIIEYIRNFDLFLADYVTCHINLFDQIKKELLKIENNWDKYIENLNKRRIDILYQEAYQYAYDYNGSLCIDSIIKYFVKKLHLEQIFYKYDMANFTHDEENIEADFIEITNTRDLEDLAIIKKIAKLIKELFKSDVINSNIEYETKDKCQIVKVDFKNKTH